VSAISSSLADGEPAALFLGGTACREPGLVAASRIAAATGARLLCETFPARLARGAGLPAVDRLAYLAEHATKQLDGLRHLVLVDAKSPVSFFAYPGRPSDLVPDGCEVHVLARASDDAVAALEALARAVDAPDDAAVPQPPRPPDLPTGPLTPRGVADVLGHLLPDGAIVSDEGNTAGAYAAGATAGAPRHDWLCLTGGAIGQGLPVAVGAAIACPGRRVIALQADGSAMYTPQSLWTMARERLDVTTLLLSNRSYAVLNMELDRVGATAGGPRAKAMLDLSDPELDMVALASATGVPACRANTCEELAAQLAASLDTPGPMLIDCVLP
jgi:acetolactate synthase-1/2/3 large subunit